MGKIDKYFLNHTRSRFSFDDKVRNIDTNISYMINRSSRMFEYKNLPDTIPQKELELLLQINGYAVFTVINGNYYVCYGGLGGVLDEYYRPTIATVTIPYFNYTANLAINTECFIIHNDTLRMGLIPIYEKYSNFLCENEISMMLSIINKRSQSIISANDDNTVESAKAYLKDLQNGKLGVIAEQRLFDSLKVHSTTNNGTNNIKDLIELQQYFRATMFNEIGLNANFNMKRERLNTGEVELNSDSLYPLIDDMLAQRRNALEKINAFYGLNIEVDFASSWEYRINTGESIDGEIGEGVENNVESVDNTETATDEPQVEETATEDNLPTDEQQAEETATEDNLPTDEQQAEETTTEDNLPTDEQQAEETATDEVEDTQEQEPQETLTDEVEDTQEQEPQETLTEDNTAEDLEGLESEKDED